MKVITYGRVSQVKGRSGESFLSPRQQQEKTAAWAKACGATIVKHIEDLDESGGTIERPGFQQAIAMIENGEAEAIITAKLDRFARTMYGAHQAIERIQKAGGTFVSVDDGFDLKTPTGMLMFNVLASFAQFERDRMVVAWAGIQEDNVNLGIPTRVPFGYMRGMDLARRPGDIEGRGLVPLPDLRPIVTEMFMRSARGAGCSEIATWLNERGVTTTTGHPWRNASVRVVLSNRVYLGEVSYGKKLKLPNAHAAMVEPGIFHAAQKTLSRRATRVPIENPGLLSGLLRCASCRYAMSYKAPRKNGRPGGYECGHENCPSRVHVPSLEVEGEVLAWVRTKVEDTPIRLGEGQANGELQETLANAEANLREYQADIDLPRLIGMDAFKEQLGLRVAAVSEAADALAASVAPTGPLPPFTQLREMPVDAQRRILGAAIDVIFVRGRPGRGKKMPIEGRVLVLPAGEGPVGEELPCRGDATTYALRAFPFPDDDDAVGVQAA